MKSFIWIAINIIGFFILIFMYNRRDKTINKKTSGQKFINYIKLSVILYLIFDTTGQLLNGIIFDGSHMLHYISTVVYFTISILPGFFYLLYCDSKVYAGTGNVTKRVLIYSIPIFINTILILTNPFTDFIFVIDDYNTYIRGDFFWVSMAIAFGYVLSVYPLLAIKTKNKPSISPKSDSLDLYLYLFPIPPVILATVQLINSELLLVGIGFVISVFIIFLANIQSSDDKRSLSVRFLNINIFQFAVIAFVMTVGVLLVLDDVTEEISIDYAQYNSISTVNLFEAYINKEIGILGTTASTVTITNWFVNEENLELKQAAFDDFKSTLQMLYSDNLYIVLEDTRHAYVIELNSSNTIFDEPLFIDENDPTNEWYFDFKQSGHEYILNVDIDNINNRKAVWLNYRVSDHTGEMIGAITVGMDLSRIAERVFTEFDHKIFRGFIIDENGIIQMDSSLLGDIDFLMYGEVNSIFEEIQNHEFHEALHAYLNNYLGHSDELSKEMTVINMQSGQYRYATITPISNTRWSVVKLYDSSSLFDITKLLPLLLILAFVFIIMTFSTSRITQRLIFTPINNLVDSLLRIRSDKKHMLYGTERNDEIGLLSNTIQEYYTAGYFDGLTGIYNRRYFEMTLQQLMNALSRNESKLSVLMMDVDFFKKYNDTYGHAEGDSCLKAIAEALGKAMQRKGDFAARYGGEEFVIVLPETDEEGAKAMADRILSAIRDLKIPHEKNDSSGGIATLSIGVTTGITTISQNGDEYLKKADEALYISKESGRNRYSFLAM